MVAVAAITVFFFSLNKVQNIATAMPFTATRARILKRSHLCVTKKHLLCQVAVKVRLCFSLPQVAESSGSRRPRLCFCFALKGRQTWQGGVGWEGSRWELGGVDERLRVESRVDAARRS